MCVCAIERHTDLPVLIPACVSCMGMLRVVQYAYSKCKCVCVSEQERERKKGRDSESKRAQAYPRGSNLNHRIFLTLRASGRSTEGGERRKEKERKAGGKEQSDGGRKRGAKSLEGSWKASRILRSNQP